MSESIKSKRFETILSNQSSSKLIRNKSSSSNSSSQLNILYDGETRSTKSRYESLSDQSNDFPSTLRNSREISPYLMKPDSLKSRPKSTKLRNPKYQREGVKKTSNNDDTSSLIKGQFSLRSSSSREEYDGIDEYSHIRTLQTAPASSESSISLSSINGSSHSTSPFPVQDGKNTGNHIEESYDTDIFIDDEPSPNRTGWNRSGNSNTSNTNNANLTNTNDQVFWNRNKKENINDITNTSNIIENTSKLESKEKGTRPQSRKLYLSQDSVSDPRIALRIPIHSMHLSINNSTNNNNNNNNHVMMKETSRSMDGNSTNQPSFRRTSSWNYVGMDELVDPEIRPPSRQKSAFPIHLADEPNSHSINNHHQIHQSHYKNSDLETTVDREYTKTSPRAVLLSARSATASAVASSSLSSSSSSSSSIPKHNVSSDNLSQRASTASPSTQLASLSSSLSLSHSNTMISDLSLAMEVIDVSDGNHNINSHEYDTTDRPPSRQRIGAQDLFEGNNRSTNSKTTTHSSDQNNNSNNNSNNSNNNNGTDSWNIKDVNQLTHPSTAPAGIKASLVSIHSNGNIHSSRKNSKRDITLFTNTNMINHDPVSDGFLPLDQRSDDSSHSASNNLSTNNLSTTKPFKIQLNNPVYMTNTEYTSSEISRVISEYPTSSSSIKNTIQSPKSIPISPITTITNNIHSYSSTKSSSNHSKKSKNVGDNVIMTDNINKGNLNTSHNRPVTVSVVTDYSNNSQNSYHRPRDYEQEEEDRNKGIVQPMWEDGLSYSDDNEDLIILSETDSNLFDFLDHDNNNSSSNNYHHCVHDGTNINNTSNNRSRHNHHHHHHHRSDKNRITKHGNDDDWIGLEAKSSVSISSSSNSRRPISSNQNHGHISNIKQKEYSKSSYTSPREEIVSEEDDYGDEILSEESNHYEDTEDDITLQSFNLESSLGQEFLSLFAPG